MKPEIVNSVHEQLQKLFYSCGKLIESSKKPVLRQRPQDPITTAYEFKSPMGQLYIVSFKSFNGDASIVVDPPIGENTIIAKTPHEAEELVIHVKAMLELEQKITQPLSLARTAQEKVLA